MALTVTQPWQCFTCHMDCAACNSDDHTVPYEQYDHPPAFPDNDDDEEEEIISVKGDTSVEDDGEDVRSVEFVSAHRQR